MNRTNYSLDLKIGLSKNRIVEWYYHWHKKVYVSFSGGKDSTVLLHLVRNTLGENVPAVFIDTGLEYPEIRDFVKTIDNVIWIKPKMNFKQVIEKYGYPLISKETAQIISEIKNTKDEQWKQRRLYGIKKDGTTTKSGVLPKKYHFLVDAPFKISHQCCYILKKNPIKNFEKKTGLYSYIGITAGESRLRQQSYSKYGCNAFNKNPPSSRPIMFWSEDDIWDYIKLNNLTYSDIYNKGLKRTGCMFCMFGLQYEDKFGILKEIHPEIYEYCMNKLKCKEVLDFINKNNPDIL